MQGQKLSKEKAIVWLESHPEGSEVELLMAKGVDEDDSNYTEIEFDDIENVVDNTYYDFELWPRLDDR